MQTRKRFRIGFDGVPYRIADEIISNTLVCTYCKKEFCSQEEYSKHQHNDANEVPIPVLRFGNVLLAVGAGHMEKNLILAIFKLCKDVFLYRLAHLLGFRTSKAKEFIFNCGDHHISWQILQIMYEAFSQELIRIYVISCNQQHIVPTAAGFSEWRLTKAINPNFNFIYDLVYNILLGLICYRAG